MGYCADCMRLAEGRCPNAPLHRLREPEASDPVFVAQLGFLRAELLCQALDGENIPYLRRGKHGAGLQSYLGPMTDQYELFVPFGALSQAQALLGVIEAPAAETPDGECASENPRRHDREKR